MREKVTTWNVLEQRVTVGLGNFVFGANETPIIMRTNVKLASLKAYPNKSRKSSQNDVHSERK